MPPLAGYRLWKLGPEGELSSIMPSGLTWSTGETVAECHRDSFFSMPYPIGAWIFIKPVLPPEVPIHPAPAPDCSCGLFAFYDPRALLAAGEFEDRWPDSTVAWGRIEASGRVQRHRLGFRAERARIVALLDPRFIGGPARRLGRCFSSSATLRAASERYGVPIERKSLLPRVNADLYTVH